MAQKNKNQVKKEFDFFAQRIARLESLKHELDSLNTKGFEDEVKLIRSRLKDIDAVPEIERDLGVLRDKIREKSEHHTQEVTPKLKKKIDELEKLIIEKRKTSSKNNLTHEEREYIHDVPQLEKQLNALKKDFEKHTSSPKMKVDSGVGVIVDSKFDDFISSIKGELSKRLKEKQLEIDTKLELDIEQHKHLFEERYHSLVQEFHDKYKQKVASELKNEVKAKFDELLEQKLSEERHSLVKELLNENARRLAHDRKQLMAKLEKEYADKESVLKNNYEAEMQVSKQKLQDYSIRVKKQLQGLEEEHRKLKNQQETLHSKEINVQKRLESEHNSMLRKYSQEKANLLREVENKRLNLSKEKEYLEKIRKQVAEHEKELVNIARKKAKISVAHKMQNLKLKQISVNKMKEKLVEQHLSEKKKLTELQEKLEQHTKQEEIVKRQLTESENKIKQASKHLANRERQVSNEINRLKSEHVKLDNLTLSAKEKLKAIAQKQRFTQSQLQKQKKLLQMKYVQEQLILRRELEKAKKHEQFVSSEIKKKYDSQLAQHKKKTEEHFFSVVSNLKKQFENEFQKKASALKTQQDAKLQSELRKRESEIRNKIQAQYSAQLENELKKRSADMERKKAELERHVMEQARKLFN